MKMFTGLVAFSLAVAGTVAGFPAQADAQISAASRSILLHQGRLATHAGEVKGMDVAYDPTNNRYLVVTSFGQIYGVFVDGDSGAAIGTPFLIPRNTGGFPHYPRVTYSPDLAAGAGGFLISWPEYPTIQVTSLSLAGDVLGPQQQLWDGGIRDQAAPAVAYSRTSRRFLVAWQTNSNAIKAHLVDVLAGSGAISKTGGPIDITNPQTSRDPGVAWDSATDQFGISYTGWDSTNALAGFVRLSSAGGSPIGRQHFGHTSRGTYMSDIEFNPSTNRFVMVWTNNAGTNRAEISSGSEIISSSLVSSAFGGTDNLGIAYNPVSGTFLAVGQPSGLSSFALTEIVGVELDSNGAPFTEANLVTAVSPTKPTYYPRVAASSKAKRWDIAYNYADLAMTSQLIATASTGSGGATPPPPAPNPAPTPAPVDPKIARERARADFNGDGSYDILWQNISDGYLAAWTLTGNKLKSSDLLSHRNTDNNWRMVATGDFNADGKPDIVWQHITQGWVGVWYMDGLNLIDSVYLSINRVLDTGWKIVGAGDFNGDGKTDIAWQHQTQRWLAVWLMNGISVTSSELMAPNKIFDARWKIVGVADINLDMKADLVWRHSESGDIGAWLMNGLSLVDSIAFNPGRLAEKDWEIAGIIDANADGKPDLVWHHVTRGDVGVWYMNGNDLIDSVWLGPGRVGDTNWKVVGPK